MPSLLDSTGRAAGILLAPVFAAGSKARGTRVLHPEGRLFRARVSAVADSGAAALVASQLEGEAAVRFSNGWWRGREWPDVLGAALRFGGVEPSGDTQDLLLATIRKPWTLPGAPLTTDQHDFFANNYFGISPFEAPGLGRVRFRLVPRSHPHRDGGDRYERLRRAVEEGHARFELQWRRALPLTRWRALCAIALVEELPGAQVIRFHPFQAGRGVVPRGFIHSLRWAAYAASQQVKSSWPSQP